MVVIRRIMGEWLTMMSVLTLVSGKEDRTLRRIRVSEIARNPNQPRKYFDPEAIAQLADSMTCRAC